MRRWICLVLDRGLFHMMRHFLSCVFQYGPKPQIWVACQQSAARFNRRVVIPLTEMAWWANASCLLGWEIALNMHASCLCEALPNLQDIYIMVGDRTAIWICNMFLCVFSVWFLKLFILRYWSRSNLIKIRAWVEQTRFLIFFSSCWQQEQAQIDGRS